MEKAMDLGENVNLLIENFPKKDIYNLLSQLLRAISSVALNISEGSIGQSNPEQNQFKKYYNESFHLMTMMLAFRKNLK